jgi:putative ABC transport system permease protein
MKYLIKELRRHSSRTIASISGYIISTVFILLALSVTLTNEKSSFGILKGTGTHFIVYVPTNTSCCVNCDNQDSKGSLVAEGVNTIMLTSDLIDSVKKINGVRDAAPYLLYKLHVAKYSADISLGGIDMNSIATTNNVCAKTNLIAGKFLSDKPDELVAEESFAMAHNLVVGDTLKAYGSKFLLAGIINSGIKPGKADVYAPIGNVRRILREDLKCMSPGFDMNIILVEVADSRIQSRVISQLKDRMKYFSISSYNCYQPASQAMSVIEKASTLLTVVIFIFLLIFSARTQFTSLMERSREIGILKSLGWSNTRLSNQIILLSLIQAFTGVIVGILTGLIIILLLNSNQITLFNTMEFNFRIRLIPLLIAISLAGGLVAGILPIIKLHRTKAGDMINNYM